MKFSPVFIGLMSLVAGALATRVPAPKPITEPVYDDAVQLNHGLIKAFGRPNMCLAAIKSDDVKAETQIQLQPCDRRNDTQIWKFNTSMKAIQLAFPSDNNKTQCLTAIPEPASEAGRPCHYLGLAPCSTDDKNHQQRFMATTTNGIRIGGGTLKNRCIDVPRFDYSAGTRVIMYKCKVPAEANQQWVVISA
ncbi:hypothetical protein BGZ68_009288 [Mortierella alpina]|nr:hypothetical protein BGZ68_009288 [Mortierella alpina]